LAIAALGAVLIVCTWLRIPTDYQFNTRSFDDRELHTIFEYRMMHIAGLVPSLILVWFQVCVLAAISVAISTRLSLVVNLPTVIIIYIAGNLTRFLFPIFGAGSDQLWGKRSLFWKVIAYTISVLLPFLETFDLRAKTIYSHIALAGTQFASDINAVPPADIWRYVGVSALYAIAYTIFALSIGMLLFQNRELGGGES